MKFCNWIRIAGWTLGACTLLHGQSPESSKSLIFRSVEIRVPLAEAGKAGLQTELILPGTPGKHPLVLMTHGSSYSNNLNRSMGPGEMRPGAVWFARRGWVVAIVMRRGYGNSGGHIEKLHSGCSEAGFAAIAQQDAADLLAVYDAVRDLPQVDGSTVIATGNSAGGFAALALGAHAPQGLRAIINFSGGWHSQLFSGWCARNGLIPEIHNLGAATRVPTLWLYAKNDRLFAPRNVALMHEAFTSGGGTAELPAIGKSGSEGHFLFFEGMQIWTPIVETFLNEHGLPWKDLDPDYGSSPSQLPASSPPDMKEAFLRWQKLGPYGAFATSPKGEWGYCSGRKTLKLAEEDALDRCRNEQCRIVATQNQ